MTIIKHKTLLATEYFLVLDRNTWNHNYVYIIYIRWEYLIS